MEADKSNINSDLARIVRRSDCECPQICFPASSASQKPDVIDISMGFTIEIHFADLSQKNPNLAALNATCNRIAILSCSGANRFENLVWLDLSHNMLTAVPSDLAEICPFLVHIDFSSNHFTDLISVQNLGALIKLHHIDFSYNQIHSLAGIQHLTSVAHIDLHRNRIESTAQIIGCLRLTRLNIAHNLLKSVAECISTVGKLPNMRRLDIYGNPFCVADGNADFRAAFALKTRIIHLDGVNIRSINSDLPPSFLRSVDPTVGNLMELRRLFEDKLRGLHGDHQHDMDRLRRLIEELEQKFDDRCKRLALDYEAATTHSVHTLR